MPTRLRARDERGQLVTILQGTLPKRGKVRIRNANGFPEEVDAKTLKPIAPDDPAATLRFGGDER